MQQPTELAVARTGVKRKQERREGEERSGEGKWAEAEYSRVLGAEFDADITCCATLARQAYAN